MSIVLTVIRYYRITKEGGEALRRNHCSVPLGEVEAVHHTQQERQHRCSYTSELWHCAEGSQGLAVAGERVSDSGFPVGSDGVESLFCRLP